MKAKKVLVILLTQTLDAKEHYKEEEREYSERMILRKQAFFFDTKKIFSKFDETLWVSRYMSNEVIFQISASWVIGNITGRSETDF